MAWEAIGYDENTGKVRWFNNGQEQFLDAGQDPNAGVAADPFGWNPNATMPAGGWSAGALLQPNYGASAVQGMDQNALAAALRDVAPGYTPTYNADGTINLNAQVPVDQQRAPASDFELIPSLLAAVGSGAIFGGFGQPGGGLLGELGNYFKSLGGDGITSTMASGANPTQVGGSYFAEGLGPNWADLPSYADSGGWESWLPDANNVYNPVSANDPIGELIRQLDNGVPSADALKAVESALPGTTRSALEQFLYNSGTGASNLLKSGLGNLFGGNGGIGGTGSTDGFSLSKLLGAVGPGIGGYLASNAQADAYRDIANKQLGEGQWARDMLKQSYADPNAYLQGEGKTFLDDAAKRQAYALSTGGNPIGSGNQLTQMMSDAYARNAGALGQYRGGLTSAGYGVPYQAGSQAQMNAVGQQGAGWNALGSIGSGINDIFNPKPTAAQTLAELLKLK